ncbi:MAG TPA: ABC transporter permease, partial [Petrotoga sp.]|nr:ABC transporter permease [Petrotoga sp.]
MENLVNLIFSTEFGYSIFRVTTPILFAAMAVLISDKAGVVNIGLEGIMLMSALTGVIGSTLTGSLWVGLLSAILGGVLMAMFLAYFSLYLKADIILTGIVLNLMSSGLTVFILYLLTGQKGISSSLQSRVFPTIDIP